MQHCSFYPLQRTAQVTLLTSSWLGGTNGFAGFYVQGWNSPSYPPTPPPIEFKI